MMLDCKIKSVERNAFLKWIEKTLFRDNVL